MASPPPLPERSLPRPPPPPLPPRNNSQLLPPPPYSAEDETRASLALPGQEGPQILASKIQIKDPRTSSSQSLVPSRSDSDSDARRTLLLVYIHGFYGNDQSFRSFPAHVHDFLREALSETHVVHSKLYPRYKTYKSIDVARDNFSAWLEPHESPTTDVILIGHSMGGILAAETVLMPNQISSRQYPPRHRILGTLSLDSPFLGLHPGIVGTGISSLFQPAPATPGQDAASPSPSDAQSIDLQPLSPTTSTNSPRDPNFDRPFFNDAPFKEKSFLTRMINFSSKHWSEGLISALGNHIISHLEFGGCLADYRGLISRYNQIRALEDVDDLQALSGGSSTNAHTRVRFVNYYTLSSGRPKPPPTAEGSRDTSQLDLSTNSTSETKIEDQLEQKLVDSTTSAADDDERNPTAAIDSKPDSPTKENKMDEPVAASVPKEEEDIKQTSSSNNLEEPKLSLDPKRLSTLSMQSMQSMQEIDPVPMDEDEHDITEQELETKNLPNISDEPSPSIEAPADEKRDASETRPVFTSDMDLPPIPDAPNPPELPDLSIYTDKDSRKQAEKEFGRLQKAYENAVKDRDKALREREKLIEKRQKKIQKDAQKDADKLEKDTKKQKQRSKEEKRRLEREKEKAYKAEKKRLDKESAAAEKQLAAEEAKRSAAASSSTTSLTAATETETEKGVAGKPKKPRKFCTTPSKTNGVMDSTWVSVYMDGMDEVTAHCALFLPGPHYDRLVGDVTNRIVGWVHNDLSVRAMMEMD